MNWDDYFMGMCDYVATKSKDGSIKVGCVIVGAERRDVRATGFNGFPRGIFDAGPVDGMAGRFERPLKYFYTEHAERNAVYAAAAVGVPLAGCVIYVNSLPPCADCARAIIQCGISELVHVELDIPDRWKESCGIGMAMLGEAGVSIRRMTR